MYGYVYEGDGEPAQHRDEDGEMDCVFKRIVMKK